MMMMMMILLRRATRVAAVGALGAGSGVPVRVVVALPVPVLFVLAVLAAVIVVAEVGRVVRAHLQEMVAQVELRKHSVWEAQLRLVRGHLRHLPPLVCAAATAAAA